MMVMCNKQHLSNIWSSTYEKLSNTEAELKKSVAYKKKRVMLYSIRVCSTDNFLSATLSLYL